VSFSLVGQADVPNVDGVSVFLDSGVSLNYIDVTSSGTASGEEITGFPAGMFILLWDISNTAGFDGGVTVAFAYGDDLTPAQEDALRLIRVELLVDVNLDGKVDGTDVSMVANANPSEPGSANWNPFLDVNHDGKIDDADVNLVNDHIGETSGLEDITLWVDAANNIIYGSTDHFSVFGVR
jgi:hypothetical protein